MEDYENIVLILQTGAVFIAAIGLLIGLLNWRNKTAPNFLTYDYIYRPPLLTDREEKDVNLQLQYKGQNISNVRTLSLEVINEGNYAIRSEDFERKLTFELAGEVQILHAEVLGTNPEDLKITITVEEETVSVEPVLLNKKRLFPTQNFD